MSMISLNTAITTIMGETPRTPKDEKRLVEELYQEMASAAKRCYSDLAGTPNGVIVLGEIASQLAINISELQHLPRSFYWPPGDAQESIGRLRTALPESLELLRSTAAKCAQFLSTYEDKRNRALTFLLAEGREGRLIFYGRRYERAGLAKLLPADLAKNLRSDVLGKDLTATFPDSAAYFDVQLDGANFNLMRTDLPLPTSAKLAIQREEVSTWLDRESIRLSLLDESSQEKELKSRFPHVKNRRVLLRDHKQKNADKWPRKSKTRD